ncbi:MAG: amidohydrolase family protein, partial [bacterium]|nr:amidohydrolase family protein [bacterium]
MAFDILIKDGTILDGSGKPRFRGDVGISGGTIAAVGPALAGADAPKTISASGKFVAPGFIDITSHADASGSLFLNPQQDYLLTQGVTSILVGNCGSSLAPLVSREAAASLRKWSGGEEININWQTVGEYLGELSKHPLGVNVATLMGHGTIRRGITKGESRPLNIEEVSEFSSLISRGMQEGAFGLSAGLVYGHEAAATPGEFNIFAKAIARAEGVLKVHIRNEGSNLVPAVNEMVQVARESKAHVIISHLKAIGRKSWPLFQKALEMMEHAREGGTSIHFDISPYQRTGSFLYLLLPVWAREGGFAMLLGRIADPANRSTLIEELKRQTLHYERYIIASAATPNANGRTIAEVAAHSGVSPEETILDLLTASGGRVTIFGKTLSFKNILAGVAHPQGVVASDGSGITPDLARSGALVHPRSTGTFPHFLHKFVKEKETVSWEEGIRKITALPAELAGFRGRGRILPKFAADIVVFDPDQIHERSTYQSPYTHSTGIDTVIVNG